MALRRLLNIKIQRTGPDMSDQRAWLNPAADLERSKAVLNHKPASIRSLAWLAPRSP